MTTEGGPMLVFDSQGDYTPESMEKLLSGDPFGGARDRAYDGQSWTFAGERGKTMVAGLTMRDVADCIARAAAITGDDVRPAVMQNALVEVEKMMHIYPNVRPGPMVIPMLTLGGPPKPDGAS